MFYGGVFPLIHRKWCRSLSCYLLMILQTLPCLNGLSKVKFVYVWLEHLYRSVLCVSIQFRRLPSQQGGSADRVLPCLFIKLNIIRRSLSEICTVSKKFSSTAILFKSSVLNTSTYLLYCSFTFD